MAQFICKLNVDIPAEVRVGTPVRATVVVESASAPVKSIVFAIDAYGIRQALRRVNENTFGLSLTVPPFAPRGNYKISVWAVSEAGDKSEVHAYQVVLK